MDIKHIIWDWNGTLLDDRWLCVDSINLSLRKRNLPEINEQKYLDIFCFPVEKYYQKLGFDFEKEPFTVSGSEFISNYNSRFHEPDLQKGVREILASIHNANVSQSVLSAGKQEYVDDWVQFHGLKDYFINVLGIDNHYASGKKDIGKQWINEMECDPNNVLLIGDTLHDHEVASEMGVHCVLIANGHTSYDRLKNTGEMVFKDLNELHDHLKEILPVN